MEDNSGAKGSVKQTKEPGLVHLFMNQGAEQSYADLDSSHNNGVDLDKERGFQSPHTRLSGVSGFFETVYGKLECPGFCIQIIQ